MSNLRTYVTSADHPSIGMPCAACNNPIARGDITTLVPLGPGGDLEEQEKARAGRPYIAIAALVHAACAGVLDSSEPDDDRR